MLALVDTGPLVAILDSGDSWHPFVRERWAPAPGQWVTTGAVLTEAMHFLAPIPGGPQALLRFIEKAGFVVEDGFRGASLRRAVALMEKYADIPMDFADASLVALARELGVNRIATLDERGFRAYRFGRNHAFHLLLQDTAP